MTTIIKADFDYSTLPADVATDALSLVAELRDLERRAVQEAAGIGRKLISIRERLDHGLFLKWIEAAFGSKSTAYRYINLAEHLADELPTVGSLPLKVVYALAAPTTPDTVRAEIVTRLKAGEQIAPRQIVNTVQDAREADKAAKAEAKLSPEERKKRDQATKRQRRSAAEREAQFQRERREAEAKQEAEAAATAEAMQMLVDRFSDDELRVLVDLFDRGDLHDLVRALSGHDRGWFFRSPKTREILEPWIERGRRLFPQMGGRTRA